MIILATLQDCPIGLNKDNHLTFTAKMAVDDDGLVNNDKDPDHQSDTNLHYEDKPLNSLVDKYIVLPMFLFAKFKPIGLGSLVHVRNTVNGKTSDAVVGDKGPNNKIGEGSQALASALGLDPNSLHGGTDAHDIEYDVVLGVAANVDGRQYTLTPS